MTDQPTPPETRPPGPDEARLAAGLHRVLVAHADTITVPDGSLRAVLERAGRRSRWASPVLAAAACAAAVVVAAALIVHAGEPAQPAGRGVQHPSGTAVTADTPPASTSSSVPSRAAAVPVYYAVVSNGAAVLYREFHPATGGSRWADAASQSLADRPADPQYGSLFPAGTTVLSAVRTGPQVTLVLSAGPARYPGVAVQQLVYSVTAADPTITTVGLRYGAVTVAPVGRGDPARYLAPVWLLTPAAGASVSAPVTLSGVAAVFEGVVNWEVDRPGPAGAVLASGSAVASPAAPARSPWSVQVQLAPGRYVARAFEISPKDGTRHWVDSKQFTVR